MKDTYDPHKNVGAQKKKNIKPGEKLNKSKVRYFSKYCRLMLRPNFCFLFG